MPLTKKGSKIMSSMKKSYGSDAEAKKVFYASKNAKKIKGVDKKRKKSKQNIIKQFICFVKIKMLNKQGNYKFYDIC